MGPNQTGKAAATGLVLKYNHKQDQSLSRELGMQSKSPACKAGGQLLELSPLLPRDCTGGSWNQAQEL